MVAARKAKKNFLTEVRQPIIILGVAPLNQLLYGWRIANGYRKAEAARICDMSEPQWHELETGVTRDPRNSTLRKLSAGMGMSLEKLSEASALPPAEPELLLPA